MDTLDPRRTALLTDLYEVTMAAAYWEHDRLERATFELFFRHLPPGRGYVLFAGLEQVVQYLLDLRFHDDQIAWLRNLFVFHNVRPEFWDYLQGLRFTGDLWAAPEGTPVFPNEPILRVTAPLPEAQLVETYLMAIVNYESLVATKAARLVEAAGGRQVVEYGSRRAHGPAAAPLAARASYLAGAVGSSNLEAGHRLGVPVFGTMAHSFVMAFDDEAEAFRAFHRVFPDSAVFLLDTYDTARAARRAVDLGLPFRAVRLDSGDLLGLAREVRRILDEAGLEKVRIIASGDLDEERLAELSAAQAPIDAYGVGTSLAASTDAPALGLAYKLVALDKEGETQPRLKIAADKGTLPGVKQVYRRIGTDGIARGDTVALASEKHFGAPLLSQVVKDGAPAVGRPGLESIREYARKALASLPPGVRRLRDPEPYPVGVSEPLGALRDRLRSEVTSP
jgi:nicotinate phosphoribosyltransferase